jgi:hypothetical protein
MQARSISTCKLADKCYTFVIKEIKNGKNIMNQAENDKSSNDIRSEKSQSQLITWKLVIRNSQIHDIWVTYPKSEWEDFTYQRFIFTPIQGIQHHSEFCNLDFRVWRPKKRNTWRIQAYHTTLTSWDKYSKGAWLIFKYGIYTSDQNYSTTSHPQDDGEDNNWS